MQRRQRVLRTWILAMLPLLLATGELRAGQLAVLSRDIEIEGVSESSMPRVHAGDIVVCPAILRDGYLVILRDATGELRGALMPFHDECLDSGYATLAARNGGAAGWPIGGTKPRYRDRRG